LGGHIPAGHEGHNFRRGTYQAGAIEPGWRLLKLLTLEAIEHVVVARRGATYPAVALFRRGLFPGDQRRQTWKRTAPGSRWLWLTADTAGVHKPLDPPGGLQR